MNLSTFYGIFFRMECNMKNDIAVHRNAAHCIKRSLNYQLHSKKKATSVTAYFISMMWRIDMILYVNNSTMFSIIHPSSINSIDRHIENSIAILFNTLSLIEETRKYCFVVL